MQDNLVITDVFWERVFLHIIVESLNDQIFLYKGKEENIIKVPVKSHIIEGNKREIEICIVDVENRSFLENAKYRLGAMIDDELVEFVVSDEVAYKLETLDKIFRYSGNNYAYTIDFSVSSYDDINLNMIINSRFMREHKKWKKHSVFIESSTLRGVVKRTKLKLSKFLMNLYYQIMSRVYSKKGKNVLFLSETHDYIWGNLKAIDNRIKDRNLDKEFNVSYSFRKAVGTNQSILSWFKTVNLVAKQDVIFVDNFVPIFGFIKLHPKVKLVQTWHAGAGFKAVGYCRFGKSGSPFSIDSSHKKYTHALAGSKSLVKVFREVFGIEEEAFLPVGMPRLDNYLDEEVINKFKNKFYMKYPEFKSKKIILFAPTYRGTGQKTAFYDYSKLDFDRLYEQCGDKYIFMFKIHPFIEDPVPISEEYKDRLVDFSFYSDINDLYYITDIFITDYSSSYYEFSLMKKPMLFFTYDLCLYETHRGVYQSVRKAAPGKVCTTFDELLDAIENEDFELEKVEKFVAENFDSLNSSASDKAIDVILLNEDVSL